MHILQTKVTSTIVRIRNDGLPITEDQLETVENEFVQCRYFSEGLIQCCTEFEKTYSVASIQVAKSSFQLVQFNIAMCIQWRSQGGD